MKKNTKYMIGGIAVIGIIAYLYNQKKKSDALKAQTALLNNTNQEVVLPDNMVAMPDGTIVDTSVIAVDTTPAIAVSEPIKDTTTAVTSSSPARFDGGFEYATGSNCDPILGL